MLRTKLQKLLSVGCILPFVTLGQKTEMETDRPSESFTPSVVLKNHFQVEAGFRKEHDKGEQTDRYFYPSALLKYGLVKRMEFTVLIEEEADYELKPEKHLTKRGLEPVKVGLKYNLLDEKGILPKTSLVVRGDIPTFASPDFKGDFVAPLFRLVMESSITKKLSVIYNVGEEWEDDDVHGRFFYSFSPQLEITGKLKVFAEAFGHVSKQQKPENTIDAGFLYQVLPNLQFDIFAGLGTSKKAPDNFVEMGVSFRLPK
ncbi:MAG: hypothetical protein JWQ40_380 [Segetibacter sp.]|nr:hypothetical protein [Segetibacter sp.]